MRVFQTDVANFSVVETDGNLDVSMEALDGTTYNAVNNKIRVNNDAVLTHGSVSINSLVNSGEDYGKAYVINPDSPLNAPSFKDRGIAGNANPSWLYKENVQIANNKPENKEVDVYIAVSWKMTFKYTFAGDKTPVVVYLDLHDSVFHDNATPVTDYEFTKDAVPSTRPEDTARGFRIGFYNGVYSYTGDANKDDAAANRHDVVWGNHIDGDELKGESYKGAYSSTTYNVGDFVLNDKIVYQCTEAVTEAGNWATNSAKFKAVRIAALAPAHVSSKAYKKGDIVTESTKTYRCKANIEAHAFVSSEWDEIEGLEKLSYVHGEATGSTTAYTAMNYVTSNSDYVRLSNGAETAAANTKAERICVLTADHPWVTVTCAAWFEGTDPYVVSGAAMKCMSADMTFYSRSASLGA